MANKFSANAPTLGYLYQIRYALFVLLQRIANEPDAKISIEILDDVAFEDNGQPLELHQLKHHINIKKEASLTNSSTDLWKTIRIWSENLDKNSNVSQEIALILVTTATAPNGSIASKLRHGSSRDEGEALGEMLKVIKDSRSVSNQPCYNAFKSLSKKQQQFLISKIQIVDQSPNIADLEDKIVKRLRLSTRFPQALKSRLEGWWFERTINHLMDDNHAPISGIELQSKIDSISDELRPDTLPNDFPVLVEKDETEIASSDRIFVEQLRLIMLGNTRLRFAIGDYYRAFSQRTKWLDDGLILPDELEKYEDILVGEWRRQFEIMKEELPNGLPSESRMIELGKSLFKWAETNNHTPIRRDFLGDFSRGNYHILSNQLKVGWHPDFQSRLSHLITQAVTQIV
ncbi:ABC-three component system protein [Pseudanabaena sp. UWO310]|uniref:ABC-three component system protein n=1 Tax=Pseudanabaena sp. UWO310 TaxID=2480795 RepID=UPI0011589544|nr:ABC-three component system protein [Pseudanabaena sp. UWO310]TYQ30860.1 hypothetical protein PseudUWO310_06610 [Pseudanabaena sp. UWO310]